MLKQVGKSAIWGLIYVMASSFGATLAMIFSIISNLDMFSLDADVFFEVFWNNIMTSLIPGSLIANILCIFAYWLYKVIFKQPSELKKVEFSKVIFAFSFGLMFNLITSYILDFFWGLLPSSLIESAEQATDMLNSETYHWAFRLLAIGIATPIGEEIIFRHGFCRTLAKGNVLMGILLSSLIFGAAHGNLIQGVYTFAMGIFCCIMLLNTDNLWYPILVHMGLNSSSVIASAVPDKMSDLVFIILGFTGVLICATMLIHNDNIRAMLAKPDMVSELDKMKNAASNVLPEVANEGII